MSKNTAEPRKGFFKPWCHLEAATIDHYRQACESVNSLTKDFLTVPIRRLDAYRFQFPHRLNGRGIMLGRIKPWRAGGGCQGGKKPLARLDAGVATISDQDGFQDNASNPGPGPPRNGVGVDGTFVTSPREPFCSLSKAKKMLFCVVYHGTPPV
ncbi:MAG: hypothetical protein ABFC77_03040 [Thermoguttaceae bacterium]